MDQVSRALLAAGGATEPLYVDDVFSAYLYDGNGGAQTITNNIDLATHGGLVWEKPRSSALSHSLIDSARGTSNALASNTTAAQTGGTTLTFNSSGYSYGASWSPGTAVASWTFRRAPKFFDVVTYTGTGVAQNIPHSLGVEPGMILVKSVGSGSWTVYHRSLGGDFVIELNNTNALLPGGLAWEVSASTFKLNQGNYDNSGEQYVAYLFAHDAAADGLIQCGSFTSPATVTLGWEPQFVMVRKYNAVGNWIMLDTMRGMDVSANGRHLYANLTTAETPDAAQRVIPTATGFIFPTQNTNGPFIYMAIRRPNKPPTTGTQVFMPTVYTGTNVDNRLVNTTIAPDMVMVRQRNTTTVAGMVVGSRLLGQPYLRTGTAATEVSDPDSLDQQLVSAVEYGTAFSAMNGFWVGNDAAALLNQNTTANNHVALAFKRAPGFFDVVTYTGDDNTVRGITHKLGVAPQLLLCKSMSSTEDWFAQFQIETSTLTLRLNLNSAVLHTGSSHLTASSFLAWNNSSLLQNNALNQSYVAYLFASLPGVSKVGSYTGNGTSQTIDCGFTTGARFVLIKRTDATGNWFVWDSARGINTGTDPRLALNALAAEVTSVDSIDPDNSGFAVNQGENDNINVSTATYHYLAIA